MKISEITQIFREELKSLYPLGEIDGFIFYSLNEYLGLSKGEIVISGEISLKASDYEKLKAVVAQLKTYKPIQYILSTTEFYGCKLTVNENVLIPRPETEELVDLILSDIRRQMPVVKCILDIGTGSGCIAIALKKNVPAATVSAIDISEKALFVAKANALLNDAIINFTQIDILNYPISGNFLPLGRGNTFDIIVSNPPYICISEKAQMSKNVLDYEPDIALFVNNKDPLVFYNAISDFALQYLAINGKLYFEINEAYGKDVKQLLEKKGFKSVEIKKDINNKDRIAIANR